MKWEEEAIDLLLDDSSDRAGEGSNAAEGLIGLVIGSRDINTNRKGSSRDCGLFPSRFNLRHAARFDFAPDEIKFSGPWRGDRITDEGATAFCDEFAGGFGEAFSAIAACFVVWPGISRAAFLDFCDAIGTIAEFNILYPLCAPEAAVPSKSV